MTRHICLTLVIVLESFVVIAVVVTEAVAVVVLMVAVNELELDVDDCAVQVVVAVGFVCDNCGDGGGGGGVKASFPARIRDSCSIILGIVTAIEGMGGGCDIGNDGNDGMEGAVLLTADKDALLGLFILFAFCGDLLGGFTEFVAAGAFGESRLDLGARSIEPGDFFDGCTFFWEWIFIAMPFGEAGGGPIKVVVSDLGPYTLEPLVSFNIVLISVPASFKILFTSLGIRDPGEVAGILLPEGFCAFLEAIPRGLIIGNPIGGGIKGLSLMSFGGLVTAGIAAGDFATALSLWLALVLLQMGGNFILKSSVAMGGEIFGFFTTVFTGSLHLRFEPVWLIIIGGNGVELVISDCLLSFSSSNFSCLMSLIGVKEKDLRNCDFFSSSLILSALERGEFAEGYLAKGLIRSALIVKGGTVKGLGVLLFLSLCGEDLGEDFGLFVSLSFLFFTFHSLSGRTGLTISLRSGSDILIMVTLFCLDKSIFNFMFSTLRSSFGAVVVDGVYNFFLFFFGGDRGSGGCGGGGVGGGVDGYLGCGGGGSGDCGSDKACCRV
uniref:Uncharacterized protein n=1 Tax=Glossina palpalis gambiensis TaxID=67801 RepID=A0A1B0BVB4_9MUSC